MAKLRFLAAMTAFAGVLTFVLAVPTATAGDPCKRKDFKTAMVRDACAKGGQKAAKDVMKAYMKQQKIKSCNLCHDKLAPAYSLKPNGYDLFVKHGGQLLPAK
ncbi:MAG: hypothetical protein AB7P03_04300 [Kofleriaceae bacterium]